MQETKRYRKPTTGAEIRQLLDVIGMEPPPRAGLEAISQTEGQKFALALVKVANNEDDGQIQRKYLRSILNGVSQRTLDALMAANLPIPSPTRLVEIAKAEGMAFFNALSIVEIQSGDQQERRNAKNYLENIIDEYGGGERLADLPNFTPSTSSVRPEPAPQNRQEQKTVATEQPKRPAPRPAVDEQRQERRQSVVAAPEKAESQFGDSYKIYGGKAALCFAETKTRSGGKPTITIEVAEATGGGGEYNWSDKWGFQLTPSELFLVYGLFMGLPETFVHLDLVGHGKKNDKSISIANQGYKFFVSMSERGSQKRAVPIPAKDGGPVIAMLGSRILADNPALTWGMLGEVTRRVCGMHMKSDSRSQNQDAY